ncbi:GNAT family N-acetyltransferase [Brevibacillus sp. DP1.3A]|uniref:GNAT family N-acetyltransferase n=1 Tax=Brevibacillus sp. DP1.3A TaxID=2738867 RepID=UPI00156B56A2|nr:GNAT family N-acetyltransferase [Brevibacillus sp. DP1.3A]UED76617.1 GNAT family N-acetyltransferase [Brevibacillus sp. DP1.3A]
MIHRLEPNEYAKIRMLLSPDNVNDLTIHAIINGTNRGAIYVDDVEQPRTALVDQTGVISIFVGDAANEAFTADLGAFIEGELRRYTTESCGGTHFLAVVPDESWEVAVTKAISHREIETDWEYYYQFNPEQFQARKDSYRPLPEGYTLKKIDAGVIENDPDNILIEVVEEFYHSVDDFLQWGVGFCVCKGNTIVSACLSCCIHEHDHEISVETYEEADMNKGIATLACVAYLEHCMEHGLTPHWTTLETNEESVRLGTKLGFEPKEKCKILEFEY